ncbi:MAG: Radical SAM superfamily protein [Methanocella sp. PtaU1.Bin125]|nr:MAG: Radical SAM superfamily protein [Methanocella sp. PtaU1.Bin125]
MAPKNAKKKKIEEDFTGSMHNALPEGCRLCHQGAKLVLFVTGVCGRDCFYCPVSAERKDVDVTYANERRVHAVEDVIDEAKRMNALGTGITGGEPLARPERVLFYIRLLKQTFGRDHHVHLYTCTAPSPDMLDALHDAGLDEIRLHPPEDCQDCFYGSVYHQALKYAIELGMSAGVEIPAIRAVPMIEKAVAEEGGFLNLNELEFSETNCEAMRDRGYALRDDVSNAVAGSEAVGREIVLNSIANTRYCSSRFKDAVQLRERLKRTASNVARPFDEVTADGTLVYGEITGDVDDALQSLRRLDIPEDMYRREGDRIEMAWWLLDEAGDDIAGTGKSIVERYPLKDGLIVERIPL